MAASLSVVTGELVEFVSAEAAHLERLDIFSYSASANV